MRDLEGKVAVVTGAASGIGRALASRFAAERMRVVLADIEEGALTETTRALESKGAAVLAVPTDVTKQDSVEELADRAVEVFGGADLVCNNAGVAVAGPVWEHTLHDWEWVIGVNLWGVIHGVRTFVPRMIAQGEGHIVNTASVAGLTSSPLMGVYNVTKHGVVTLSETLARDLDAAGSDVKVSVLCPGFVQTRILDSDRNRPGALPAGADRPRPEEIAAAIESAIREGLSPDEVAAQVVDGIRADRFYILTHPEYEAPIRERMEDVLSGRVRPMTMLS